MKEHDEYPEDVNPFAPNTHELVVGWSESCEDDSSHLFAVVPASGAAVKICTGERLAPWEWSKDQGVRENCLCCLDLDPRS